MTSIRSLKVMFSHISLKFFRKLFTSSEFISIREQISEHPHFTIYKDTNTFSSCELKNSCLFISTVFFIFILITSRDNFTDSINFEFSDKISLFF